MSKVAVLVEFTIKPSEEAFATHIRNHAAATLAEEPGCLQFDVLIPRTEAGTPDPSRIQLVEVYADQAAFDAHRANPRMPSVAAGSRDLLEKRTLTVCDIA